MREEKYICDICDTDIKAGGLYVVKMEWVNQNKSYDFHLCKSCRNEIKGKVPTQHDPADKEDHSFFKEMLRLFNRKQKGK